MMNRKILIVAGIVISISLIGGILLLERISEQSICEIKILKEACINATIGGIELDIERHQKWLEIGAEPREEIESRLNKLKAELEKYRSIQLQDYEIPEKREVIGWVNQHCTENTILQIENMTRSGPFYHIVGIKGEDYTVIKPKTKYRMTIYLVYPRYYPFPSYYIYIDSWKQIPPTVAEISREEALKLANQALEKECNLSFSQIERIKWAKGPDIENLKKEICPRIDEYNENEIWRGKISLNENIETIALVGIYGKFVCLYGLDKRAALGIISVDKACRQEEEVTVTTDKTEYEQGEKIKITIRNNLNESIFSYIGSATPVFSIEYIERKKPDGTWEKLFAYCRSCIYKIAAPQEIKPGQSETFEWEPLIYINGTSEYIQAPVGIYRVAIGYQISKNWKKRIVYSNEFTIKEKGEASGELVNTSPKQMPFTKYYSLDPLNVKLQTAQYNLPLKTNEISNFNNFESRIKLSDEARKKLQDKGFVIIENPFNPQEEDITRPYKTLKYKEIPIFITSDSLLHLYHIQFDETLRQIEEREFYDKIWDISKTLYNYSIEQYNNSDGDLKEAARRNVAYFAVGLELLKPKEEQICKKEKYGICYISDYETTDELFMKEEAKRYIFEIPDFVKEDVDKELELIEKHEGFSESPIFIYREDYSQYVPRGHYTRSEKLKNYFRAFMWYGRISMLLKGDPEIPPGETCQYCKALISTYDAKIQTIQACLIASEFAKNKELKDKWDRIYSVTAFYVGFSDDLGPYEYLEAMNAVFGDRFDVKNLTEENIGKLKAKLAEYRTPEIYGGTGQQFVSSAGGPDEVLANTQGFRLMGQRFIPDSYIFQNLVFGYVTEYLGNKKPFTMVFIDGVGPARGFPRGLDVMSLLGSNRAMELLEKGDDTNYRNYSTQYAKLKEEFDNFTVKDWNKNLYWSWLYALKPLLKEFGKGYPTFMQTKAWQDKELTTALASWAELRHDTILYAKQSYTMSKWAAPIPPPEKPVVGYVEPVPEFYNRLLALTRMTNKGLDEMDVLDDTAKYRLQNLERILERLVNISKKELENEELTRDDYDFIKNFGEELNSVIEDVDDKAKKTTIIADVHTDMNTKKVLEEGVGYVKMIVVAYKLPDNRILIGAGPVFSYYEFKHPMKDRLTDEKWREILRLEPPDEMEWVKDIRG